MMTNRDKFISEWSDLVYNDSTMNLNVKKMHITLLNEYIDIVDDIQIWNTLRKRNYDVQKKTLSKNFRTECIAECFMHLLVIYCIFLTIGNVMFLQFLL